MDNNDSKIIPIAVLMLLLGFGIGYFLIQKVPVNQQGASAVTGYMSSGTFCHGTHDGVNFYNGHIVNGVCVENENMSAERLASIIASDPKLPANVIVQPIEQTLQEIQDWADNASDEDKKEANYSPEKIKSWANDPNNFIPPRSSDYTVVVGSNGGCTVTYTNTNGHTIRVTGVLVSKNIGGIFSSYCDTGGDLWWILDLAV